MVSEVKEIYDKPYDPPEKDTKLFEDTQGRQFKSFGSEIVIKEENKESSSCNLAPVVERPLYHIAREINRLGMLDKKSRFVKPIHDSNMTSLDNFDSKFSDYLLRKNYNNIKLREALDRREELERSKEQATIEELLIS